MKRHGFLAGAAALGLADLPTIAFSAEATETIKIGVSLAVTGAIASEGLKQKRGVELFTEYVNAHGGFKAGGKRYKYQTIYYDDQGNPQQAAQLVDRLITVDKVDFLLSPYGSGLAFAASAVAEKNNKLMMLSGGASDDIYTRGFKNIFGTISTTSAYMPPVFAALAKIKNGPKSIANIFKNDLANNSTSRPVEDLAKEYKFDLAYNQRFDAAQTDFTNEITAIKSKNPDVVIIHAQAAQAIKFFKQMSELRYKPKLTVTNIAASSLDFASALGGLANGIVGPVDWDSSVHFKDSIFGDTQKFAKAFEDKYGYAPQYHSAYTASGLEALQLAIVRAGSTDQDKVREALQKTDVETAFGKIRFGSNGALTGRSMYVGQIRGGLFVVNKGINYPA